MKRIYTQSSTGKITFILGIVFFSCGVRIAQGQATAKKELSIKNAEWLIGLWENKRAKGSTFEQWSKASESELKGKSFMIKEKDTIVFENVRLVMQKDGVFYIPMVKDQNNGKEVPFRSTSLSSNEMIFENPEHDFPQKITYVRITQDSLVAEISGTMNGKAKSQRFPMRRVRR